MDDTQFNRGPARRPMTVVGDPLLQWATGLQTRQRSLYAGWLAEKAKHEEFDMAMEAAGFSTVVIKHGTGSIVEHWAIETANLFVVAEGVQSIGEMKHTDERFGIAFGWRQLDGGRMQSVIRFRAYLRELLELGFQTPVLVTAKSTLTGDLLAALTRQFEVLDAVDGFRAQRNKPPMHPPFYACAIPIGPGEEVSRGSGGQTKEITPPVAKIPSPVTEEHIRDNWVRREYLDAIEGMIDDTIRWSVQTSKLIRAGDDPQRGPRQEPDYDYA